MSCSQVNDSGRPLRTTVGGRGGDPADGLASHDQPFLCRLSQAGVETVEGDVGDGRGVFEQKGQRGDAACAEDGHGYGLRRRIGGPGLERVIAAAGAGELDRAGPHFLADVGVEPESRYGTDGRYLPIAPADPEVEAEQRLIGGRLAHCSEGSASVRSRSQPSFSTLMCSKAVVAAPASRNGKA